MKEEEKHLLEIDSVLKTFGSWQLLTDVYLKLETGSITALFGRNGVGKTVLMKILYGTMKADRKFIRIDEQRVLKQPFMHPGVISYLPQDHFTPKHIALQEVVSAYLDNEAIDLYFQDDEIAQRFKKTKMGNLSSGERRYLEIKLLLLNDTHFVLLDEPFNFLSPVLIEKVKKIICAQTATKGFLISDHNYRYALDICSKIMLLDDGALKTLTAKEGLVEQGYLRFLD